MRILILGAAGMLGHKLLLKMSTKWDVLGTVRKDNPTLSKLAQVNGFDVKDAVDALDFDSVNAVVQEYKPDVVINCIGIVKQLDEAKDPYLSIAINAMFPHQLQKLAEREGFRLIHFSTDCVFSGKSGPYSEDDETDVSDLYGMTKYLGEVKGQNALTIRTSIIGHEINKPTGLVEWFLSQKGGKINGFTKALYTGLTTNAMADVVMNIIEDYKDLSGVYQVASDEISKYDLLQIMNEQEHCDVTINKYDDFILDRRLDSGVFRKATGWKPPSWREMIKTMFTEDAVYYKNA
jgi:dTDP-4-dehydrorhamnose reductase